jgi:hypothetical protein
MFTSSHKVDVLHVDSEVYNYSTISFNTKNVFYDFRINIVDFINENLLLRHSKKSSYYFDLHSSDTYNKSQFTLYNVPYVYNGVYTPTFSAPSDQIGIRRKSLYLSDVSPIIYPMATRYISRRGVLYIERPPFQTEVNYKLSHSHGRGPILTNFKIWIPWTVSAMTVDRFVNNEGAFYGPSSFNIYYSDKSLETFDDSYIISLLPNSTALGSICWSSSLHRNFASQDNSVGIIDYQNIYSSTFNEYMMGGWNSDLHSLLVEFLMAVSYGYQKKENIFSREQDYINLFKTIFSSKRSFGSEFDQIKQNYIDIVDSQKNFSKIHKLKLKSHINLTAGQLYLHAKMLVFLGSLNLFQTLEFIKQIKLHLSSKDSQSYHQDTLSYTFREIVDNDSKDTLIMSSSRSGKNVHLSNAVTCLPPKSDSERFGYETIYRNIHFKLVFDISAVSDQETFPSMHSFLANDPWHSKRPYTIFEIAIILNINYSKLMDSIYRLLQFAPNSGSVIHVTTYFRQSRGYYSYRSRRNGMSIDSSSDQDYNAFDISLHEDGDKYICQKFRNYLDSNFHPNNSDNHITPSLVAKFNDRFQFHSFVKVEKQIAESGQ